MTPPVAFPDASSDWTLKLYNTWNTEELPFPIVPCSPARDWVRDAGGGPYRCLPLKIAGEMGWALLNPAQFTVRWDGSAEPGGVQFTFEAGRHFECILSHFGHGVLTFSFPYLFRTPAGVNLWVRGPANWCRDGVQALEGLVETDWTNAPFTMNWKMTRREQEVRFEIGDPICVIVPFPRHFLEHFQPRVCIASSDPSVEQANREWQESRRVHNASLDSGSLSQDTWQRHYYRGQDVHGNSSPDHQTRIFPRPFHTK